MKAVFIGLLGGVLLLLGAFLTIGLLQR